MKDVDLYLRVREKEGRLYLDEQVSRLPQAPPSHPLQAEWRARAASALRLTAYLNRLPKPLTILDLGCGNGWLTHKLAQLPACHAWGLDVNWSELKQAARVFARGSRLSFVWADVFHSPFPQTSFNVIVLASVIQYFPDLHALIDQLFPLLTSPGELHILDSPLYSESEVALARQRTQAYYTALGFSEMAAYYHHHINDSLGGYNLECLYDPNAPLARLRRKVGVADSPFLWLRLRRT
ncbi:MAG: methyltransferase domain-containing protein [Chloroflexi bacterium]|nr:methyltransferase domain-containing protein [Chloroflexota bacterium]